MVHFQSHILKASKNLFVLLTILITRAAMINRLRAHNINNNEKERKYVHFSLSQISYMSGILFRYFVSLFCVILVFTVCDLLIVETTLNSLFTLSHFYNSSGILSKYYVFIMRTIQKLQWEYFSFVLAAEECYPWYIFLIARSCATVSSVRFISKPLSN